MRHRIVAAPTKPRLLQQPEVHSVDSSSSSDESPQHLTPQKRPFYNLRSSGSKSSPSPKNPKEEDKRKDSNKKPRKK